MGNEKDVKVNEVNENTAINEVVRNSLVNLIEDIYKNSPKKEMLFFIEDETIFLNNFKSIMIYLMNYLDEKVEDMILFNFVIVVDKYKEKEVTELFHKIMKDIYDNVNFDFLYDINTIHQDDNYFDNIEKYAMYYTDPITHITCSLKQKTNIDEILLLNKSIYDFTYKYLAKTVAFINLDYNGNLNKSFLFFPSYVNEILL